MSLADIVIILLLIGFVTSGIRHGLIWEILTTVGLLLGFGLTWYFRHEIMDLVVRLSAPGWQRQWVGGIVFLALFLIVYLGFAAVGRRIHEKLWKTPLKWVDAILGAVAGALKGAILIGLVVAAIEWVGAGEAVRGFISDSRLIRLGRRAAYDMIHWEPASKRQWV